MTIFRLLSVLTLLEGFGGAVLTIVGLPLNWMFLQKVAHPFAHATLLMYLVGLINLLFAVMLIVAGTLLWILRRRGLLLRTWTLIAEIFYCFILDTGISMYMYDRTGSGEFFQNFSFITVAGNVVIAIQLGTAFPIIAAVLIFLAYRYLGIPARPLPVKVPTVPHTQSE
jgi:hypothetical protein